MSRYGVDCLHPRRLSAPPAPGYAAAAGSRAPAASAYAQRHWQLRAASSTVQRRRRLLVLEHHSAAQARLLIERTR